MVKSRHQKKPKSKSHKTRKHHRGGSQASDLVDSFVKGAGEFKSIPETLRLAGSPAGLNLYQTTGGGGGAGCGCSGGARRMKGGSPASDYVMQRAQYVLDEATKLGNSQSQSGGRKSRKSKKTKKTKKTKRSRKMNKRGGGSGTDFRDTLYSRIVNGDRTDAVPFFNAFTNEKYISQQELANEPNVVSNPPYLQ
jgi:hypothetical protein